MEKIGEKIRRIRKSKGISQTTVSDICGIKQSSFANIENGNTQNITIEIGKGISKALDVTFDELFGIDVPEGSGSEVESSLNEKNAKIAELQKQIEQKDLLIDMFNNENSKHKYNYADCIVFENFMWLNNLEFLLNLTTLKKIKEELLQYKEDLVEMLSEISEDFIEDKTLTIQQLLNIFFETSSFLNLMEEKSTSKEEYIINCAHFINQFYNIDENAIRNYILKKVTTKWNPIKYKRQLRRDKENSNYLNSLLEDDQNINKPN